MFYEEITTKQDLSYISICSLSILYNSKFILMARFLGTNAIVVTRVHCTISSPLSLWLRWAKNKSEDTQEIPQSWSTSLTRLLKKATRNKKWQHKRLIWNHQCTKKNCDTGPVLEWLVENHSTLLMLNKLRCHATSNFQPIRLLDHGFW